MEQEMPSSSVSMKRPYFDSQEQDQQYSDNAKKHKQENDETSQEDSGSAKKQKQENDETSQEDTSPDEQKNYEEDQQGLSPVSLRTEKQENDGANQDSQDARHCIVYDEKTKSVQTDEDEFAEIEREQIVSQLGQSWTSDVDYHEDICNKWYTVNVVRSPAAEPYGGCTQKELGVYNTHRSVKKNIILEQFSYDQEIFYHGTDEISAKNIIERGIDVTMSRKHLDFSDGKGFYVTTNYEKAFEWGQRMTRRSGHRSAVIAFKVDRSKRYTQKHLSLMCTDTTNRKWWQCIVSHFRHRQTSKDVDLVLNDVTFIEGPVAMNRCLTKEDIPTDGYSQLCIFDQEYAKSFGSLANIIKKQMRQSFPPTTLTERKYHNGNNKTWSSVRITRPHEERTISVYKTDGVIMRQDVMNRIGRLRGHDMLFYHGTYALAAKRIIEGGIDVTQSTRRTDFSEGSGFYVMDNFDKALDWARRKVRRQYFCAAVIVFKVDRSEMDKQCHLSLKFDTVTNKKWWQCIVSHFRHGQTSRAVTLALRDVKFIEGPVAMNRGLAHGELPTPKDGNNFTQLCICDQEYANSFGSLANIVCVLFEK